MICHFTAQKAFCPFLAENTKNRVVINSFSADEIEMYIDAFGTFCSSLRLNRQRMVSFMRKNKVFSVVIIILLSAALLFGCNTNSRNDNASGEEFDALLALLSESGFEDIKAVDENDIHQEGFLSVPKRVISVGSEWITVYEYASNQEMEEDAMHVEPGGFGFSANGSGAQVSWVAPPHWFKKGSTIVLYVGEDSDILEFLAENYGETFAGQSLG